MSLPKIKLHPFSSLKESSFFKYLALNDYLNPTFSPNKTNKFSKETIFQKFLGFFEYVSYKNHYSNEDFLKYINEIQFKYKASSQKQKNFISLLIESLENWSLESEEIKLIKDFLMIDDKDQRIFTFYLKARKAIINHFSLASHKKLFFLDDSELEFSIF